MELAANALPQSGHQLQLTPLLEADTAAPNLHQCQACCRGNIRVWCMCRGHTCFMAGSDAAHDRVASVTGFAACLAVSMDSAMC